MTESREMMIARAREFVGNRIRLSMGSRYTSMPRNDEVEYFADRFADFAIQEIERYKESLAKDEGREEEGYEREELVDGLRAALAEQETK